MSSLLFKQIWELLMQTYPDGCFWIICYILSFVYFEGLTVQSKTLQITLLKFYLRLNYHLLLKVKVMTPNLHKYLLRMYKYTCTGQELCKNCSSDHLGAAQGWLNPFRRTLLGTWKACCPLGKYFLEMIATGRWKSHFFSIIPTMQRQVECRFRNVCLKGKNKGRG